jgi:hypothetical protein
VQISSTSRRKPEIKGRPLLPLKIVIQNHRMFEMIFAGPEILREGVFVTTTFIVDFETSTKISVFTYE